MKKRLDILVAEKGNISREKAQALIMAGAVFLDGQKATKPGIQYDESMNVAITQRMPYVSRGALKLEKAASEFGIDFTGKTVCDVGASTGGFTDYALRHGAKKVYAIDTGYGQIDQKLREDKRVVLLEKTNIKNVESLPENIDMFVIDVSFISLRQVLPAVKKIDQSSEVVALIKPQFEVGKEMADKTKGIIRDEEVQAEVVEQIGKYAEENGFRIEGVIDSPITGAKGNKEFLIYLK